MYFHNGVFESGKKYLTVRRGYKWHNMLGKHEPFFLVHMDGSKELKAKVLSTKVSYFDSISEDDLKMASNPECRTMSGLTHNMKTLYKDFSTNEDVSLVFFEVL